MGDDWLLGVAFGMAGTAAASLDPAVQRATPIALPGGMAAVAPEAETLVSALRAVLNAAVSPRNGKPPAGLALAYPDQWSPHHITALTQAAAVLGYPANLLRLVPISTATAHNSIHYPDDGPASEAARGALLVAIGPASHQIPRSAPAWEPPRASPIPSPVSATPPPASAAPPPPRAAWLWTAAIVLAVLLAGGTATAALLLDHDGNKAQTTAADATTPPAAPWRPTTSSPTAAPWRPTTSSPTAAPATAPPAPTTPSPEPTSTVRTAPTTTKPPPEPDPTTPEKSAPPKDARDAMIRGYCQGLLNSVDKFPGGLQAMKSQIAPPPFFPADQWNEAFDRAATGSCQ